MRYLRLAILVLAYALISSPAFAQTCCPAGCAPEANRCVNTGPLWTRCVPIACAEGSRRPSAGSSGPTREHRKNAVLARPLRTARTYVAARQIPPHLASPALVTDGRTAIGICIDSTASGARCEWSVNDKGEIDICNKNGCVYCPSATSQCTVASRTRPRPRLSLPVGAVVMTPVGIFSVTPRSFDLRPWCPRGQVKCPLIGCVPIGQCYFRR
jgi:hypothetical protein